MGPYNGLGTSSTEQTLAEAKVRGNKSLEILQKRLEKEKWLALGRPTIAILPSLFMWRWHQWVIFRWIRTRQSRGGLKTSRSCLGLSQLMDLMILCIAVAHQMGKRKVLVIEV